MRLKSLVAASAVVAVGVIVVGIAYAAIPGGGGRIQGCYVTKGGALRVVNAASECTKQELPLDWNQAGQPGTNGAPGVSPTVVQLSAGDAHCSAGGAKITDAAGAAAYVCSGQDGQAGQPFSGTFTSPNGLYAISVTDSGVTLKRNNGGPTITLVGDDITVKSSGTAKVEAGSDLTLRGGSTTTVDSAAVTEIKGGAFTKVNGAVVSLNGGTRPVSGQGDTVVGSGTTGSIVTGSPTVLVP